MKITCIQMDMVFADPEENFHRASALIADAAQAGADTLVLPELWTTGFFPREDLASLCDRNGSRTRREIGALAKKYAVNIVAGSVANVVDGKVYNTCMVFGRDGRLVCSYDKTHLFSPMGEHEYFTAGGHLCRFTLDGTSCGVIICYDVRFPELTRTLALGGMDLLFVVAQWPDVRIPHLRCLTTARAIENQMFVACCNSCGAAGETRYGGASAIIDPWGETLALAEGGEQAITADCDFSVLQKIRSTINVFADRRVGLYEI